MQLFFQDCFFLSQKVMKLRKYDTKEEHQKKWKQNNLIMQSSKWAHIYMNTFKLRTNMASYNLSKERKKNKGKNKGKKERKKGGRE